MARRYASSEAAEIAALCTECGVPHMAAGFLTEGITLDEAKTRISVVGTVMEMNAIACGVAPSIGTDFGTAMLAAGKSVEQIRTALFEQIVAAQDAVGEINGSTPLPMSAADHGRMAASASMERALRERGLEPVKRTGR